MEEEGPLMGLIENRFEPNLLTTTVDKMVQWARRSCYCLIAARRRATSQWPNNTR